MGVMSRIWQDLGFMGWALALALAAVLVLTAWTGRRLYRAEAVQDLRTKALVDAILFWGAFAVISGVLGTLIGIIEAAQAMELGAATGVVWGGVKQAILGTAAGMTVLFFAAVSWFVLQLRWRFLGSDRRDAEQPGMREAQAASAW